MLSIRTVLKFCRLVKSMCMCNDKKISDSKVEIVHGCVEHSVGKEFFFLLFSFRTALKRPFLRVGETV